MVPKVTATPFIFNNVKRMLYVKSSEQISVLNRGNCSLIHAGHGFLVVAARPTAFAKEISEFIRCLMVEITLKITGNHFK